MFGDSDFAANAGLGIQGNRDLFMNTVGWLSQQENLISIRPKEADDRRITLTATQQANITWLSLLIIPGFVFGAGRLHLVAEAVNARPAIHARARRRPRRPRRVHLLRHLEAARRRRDAGTKQEKVFAGVDADKIDELKVKSDERRRRRR